jgi:hypothetical protein
MWRTLIEENKFTVIRNYEDLSRAHDMSYGSINIPHYENMEYELLNHDINAAVSKGQLIVSIYTDASGTIFAKDSNNNDINLRLVKNNSYTYPYMDPSGNYVNGTFTMKFDDGSTFFNTDDNDIMDEDPLYGLWYYIQGISDMNNLHKFT